MASTTLSIVLFLLDFAINCTIVSVSEVVWKIAPSSTSLFLNVIELVKFPLWETPIPPALVSAKKGWIFLRVLSPDVLYLLCPINICLEGFLKLFLC